MLNKELAKTPNYLKIIDHPRWEPNHCKLENLERYDLPDHIQLTCIETGDRLTWEEVWQDHQDGYDMTSYRPTPYDQREGYLD